jgi:hypothetical protein
MSRFDRSRTTPAAPTAAPAPSAPPVATPAGSPAPVARGASADLLARFQALQAQGQEQNERRARYKGKLEHVIAEDRDLTAQAQALGATTPEALLEKIEAQDRADADALDRYATALDDERALLDAIDRDLAALDAAE